MLGLRGIKSCVLFISRYSRNNRGGCGNCRHQRTVLREIPGYEQKRETLRLSEYSETHKHLLLLEAKSQEPKSLLFATVALHRLVFVLLPSATREARDELR